MSVEISRCRFDTPVAEDSRLPHYLPCLPADAKYLCECLVSICDVAHHILLTETTHNPQPRLAIGRSAARWTLHLLKLIQFLESELPKYCMSDV